MSHQFGRITAWLRRKFLTDGRLGRRLALMLALALLAVFASIRRAPERLIPLGEPQVVDSAKPQVCAHTLLENEVSEWKIQRSLQLVREMGATTIVQFFPWAYFEPQKKVYSWRQFDLIVRHARNQGLQIIARLGLVPQWARPEANTTLNHLPEASYADFAEAAAALAERYPDAIQSFIIWNEPNLSFEWGYRPVDAAAYARLLEITYPRIKAANPDAIVLAGALAPTLEARGSPAGLNEIEFLREMYEHGAAAYFDALAAHSYGLTQAPEATPSARLLNFRRIELLREVMLAHDDGDKRVFITESGWNDHPRWAYAVRPSQRLAYTIRAFQFVESRWDWVDRHCIWALRFPAPTNSYPDGFTLITPEFELKPIYYGIQSYARGWDQLPDLWLPPPQGT